MSSILEPKSRLLSGLEGFIGFLGQAEQGILPRACTRLFSMLAPASDLGSGSRMLGGLTKLIHSGVIAVMRFGIGAIWVHLGSGSGLMT